MGDDNTTQNVSVGRIAPYRKTLTVTLLTAAASATLAALKTSALATDLQAIMLIPSSNTDTINWNVGAAASALTSVLPPSGLVLPISKDLADTIYLFADSKDVTLVELG